MNAAIVAQVRSLRRALRSQAMLTPTCQSQEWANAAVWQQIERLVEELEEALTTVETTEIESALEASAPLQSAQTAADFRLLLIEQLFEQLSEIRKLERRALSHELHDQVSRNITAANLALAALEYELQEESLELERAQTLVVEAIRRIEASGASIRNLIVDLRGPKTAHSSLATAAAWHLKLLETHRSLRSKLTVANAFPSLPEETEAALFQIMQEALTNVVRHAKAQLVTVSLEFQPEEDEPPNPARITIAIVDDGRGFQPEEVTTQNGKRFGILIMRERAAAVGGTFRLESEPGQGTQVIVEILQ